MTTNWKTIQAQAQDNTKKSSGKDKNAKPAMKNKPKMK